MIKKERMMNMMMVRIMTARNDQMEGNWNVSNLEMIMMEMPMI